MSRTMKAIAVQEKGVVKVVHDVPVPEPGDYEALVKVNRDLGTTTVVITHNAEIRRIAHRVLYMADGKLTRIEENATRVEPSEVSW